MRIASAQPNESERCRDLDGHQSGWGECVPDNEYGGKGAIAGPLGVKPGRIEREMVRIRGPQDGERGEAMCGGAVYLITYEWVQTQLELKHSRDTLAEDRLIQIAVKAGYQASDYLIELINRGLSRSLGNVEDDTLSSYVASHLRGRRQTSTKVGVGVGVRRKYITEVQKKDRKRPPIARTDVDAWCTGDWYNDALQACLASGLPRFDSFHLSCGGASEGILRTFVHRHAHKSSEIDARGPLSGVILVWIVSGSLGEVRMWFSYRRRSFLGGYGVFRSIGKDRDDGFPVAAHVWRSVEEELEFIYKADGSRRSESIQEHT
ncbi:hypothetical protein BJ165DRAFT_1408298 [Panaeolus papilionaceus]|nr:hypothetical protein BJ165DRAFT_1408298 [Panaeolus papilionaceus]